MNNGRDHGGGLDAAIACYGGERADWVDLSTGINPVPYPISPMGPDAWTALPDRGAQDALLRAARALWNVPEGAEIIAAPGASSLIAKLPALRPELGRVHIPKPTYNEHAAAFAAHGWAEVDTPDQAQVLVHPNNPTGHWHTEADLTAGFTIIDESFADVRPDQSLIAHATRPGTVILKSFGKFWGLAGLRLGFAIGRPEVVGPLADMLGPWPVAGPALEIGAKALSDQAWITETRARLHKDASRLDAMMTRAGAQCLGGTSLFRLYEVDNATRWQDRLARHHIWSRIFPYSKTWLRLGLPDISGWDRLSQTL